MNDKVLFIKNKNELIIQCILYANKLPSSMVKEKIGYPVKKSPVSRVRTRGFGIQSD